MEINNMALDSKNLSIPTGAWTPDDEAEAMKEGWLLAAFEPDKELVVVKFDESNIFETDKDASDYVRLIPSSLHNKARAAMGHPQIPLDENAPMNCGDQMDIVVSNIAAQTLKDQTLKDQILHANNALSILITKAMPISKDITLDDQVNIKALIIAMQSDQYKELLNPSFTSLPELIYTYQYYINSDKDFRTMDTHSACVQSLSELSWSTYYLSNDSNKLSFINDHRQSKQKDFEEALSNFLHIILVLGVLTDTNPLKRMYKNAYDRTLQWVEDHSANYNMQFDQQHTPKPNIIKSII